MSNILIESFDEYINEKLTFENKKGKKINITFYIIDDEGKEEKLPTYILDLSTNDLDEMIKSLEELTEFLKITKNEVKDKKFKVIIK